MFDEVTQAHIRKLEAELAVKDEQIESLFEQLAERDLDIQERDEVIAAMTGEAIKVRQDPNYPADWPEAG